MRLLPATRAQTKRRSPERALHISVVGFLRHAWPDDLPFYHCPNGEHRDERTAAKLKAMGTRRGVADLTFHLPKGHVGYIELKAEGGTLTDDQIAFRDACILHGHGWKEARSIEEVETILTTWLALFGRKLKATTVRRAA